MGIEIERKFLVRGDAWRSQAQRSVRMAQGYINDHAALQTGVQKASVRVRIAGNEAHLNLKSRELGHTRQEFEYAIPVADADDLLALCVGGCVEKTRHFVQHAGRTWEVDEFAGENAGLFVAELELKSADDAFEIPSWAGAEVTDEARFYNLALAARPFAQWTNEEKQGC